MRKCEAPNCDRDADYGRKSCVGHRARLKRTGEYGEAPLREATPRGLTAWGVMEHNGWTVTATGCWEYDGPRFARGYGQVKAEGQNPRLAHRISYEHFNGEVPEGLLVRHRCDNPPCVNPEHLLIGTSGDNARDRSSRGRSANGERHPLAVLTAEQVVELRRIGTLHPERIARGKALHEFAERIGIRYETIQAAWLRATWRHLDGGYKWSA